MCVFCLLSPVLRLRGPALIYAKYICALLHSNTLYAFSLHSSVTEAFSFNSNQVLFWNCAQDKMMEILRHDPQKGMYDLMRIDENMLQQMKAKVQRGEA